MKFKAIFALFNGVLVVSFLLISLMPFMFLGEAAFSLFWKQNWIIVLVFLLTLGALNTFFILNWRMFLLLEKQDWPGLVAHLEEKILGKNRIRPFGVRMLLNAYLLTSHTDGILALEAFLKPKKPGLVNRYCIQFGIPYVLMKDPAASEAFFADMIPRAAAKQRGWMKWNRAFSLLQLSRKEEAAEELSALVGEAADPVLSMLCLYLLAVIAGPEGDVDAGAAAARESLARRIAHADMKKRIEKSSDNMEILVLSKIIQDAAEWLYAPGKGAERS